MPLRIALALTSLTVSISAVLAACASQQTLEESARAACVERGVPAGQELDICIEETEEALRRAREYSPPPPPRPAGKQR